MATEKKMKNYGKLILSGVFACAITAGLYLSAPAYAQTGKNDDAGQYEKQTETNTVTIINTDEIRIVTNKQGEHAFQLKHLDILWGTRAAMSGMIAVFLLLITAFTPANSKQNITALCFIAGCALTLSFYPFGISFMIYEWNQMYGIAAMAGGAVLTAITLFMANRLRKKIQLLKEKESMTANTAETSGESFIFGTENNANNFPPPPPPAL